MVGGLGQHDGLRAGAAGEEMIEGVERGARLERGEPARCELADDRRGGAHASRRPQAPVHRHAAARGAAALAVVHEGVEEPVGGGVADLAAVADQGHHGREDGEEVERIVLGAAIEPSRAESLCAQLALECRPRLARDEPVVSDPGEVQDAAEGADLLVRLLDRTLTVGGVADVCGEVHDAAAALAHGGE
ncbi:MAG TPA: hypothetical protein VN253_29095, partial [Kofleriaceae bacterium]|nr:hypothetical protein [Kofleriaceae bacterium]